jgi:hypothetical protein
MCYFCVLNRACKYCLYWLREMRVKLGSVYRLILRLLFCSADYNGRGMRSDSVLRARARR